MNPEVIENEGKDCSGRYIDDAVLFQHHDRDADGDDQQVQKSRGSDAFFSELRTAMQRAVNQNCGRDMDGRADIGRTVSGLDCSGNPCAERVSGYFCWS